MTAPVVASDGEHRAAADAAQLVELRVTLSQLSGEVTSMRADLRSLAAVPVQLDGMGRMWQQQLENALAAHARDIADVRADIDELRSWHTWAVRIVLAAVAVAVLALVLRPGV